MTVEGKTRELPAPFFVIATQNPATQSGTYPLPESQLDRFLMRLSLGYPDPAAERKILIGEDSRRRMPQLRQVISVQELVAIQKSVDDVHTSDSLLDYVQRLVEQSRVSPDYVFGLSPRGALALVRSARTWALMQGRGHVVPEDIQMVLPSVVEHRLSTSANQRSDGRGMATKLLEEVPVLA